MPIKLVVFDMAGTTVADNNNVAQTLQKALAQFGYMVSIEEVNKVMGYPKPVAINLLLQNVISQPVAPQLVDEIYKQFEHSMIDYYLHQEGIKEMEGASDLFSLLKENGVVVGIDTGFSRAVCDVIMQRLGWIEKQLVDVSVTSDEVDNGRPFPDMIFRAMEIAGVSDPSTVAKVGDTISDIREGKAAGCAYVIGIPGKANSYSELEHEQPTHIIGHISEVARIVLT